jgi:primosomal protein N' (replication factor Y)
MRRAADEACAKCGGWRLAQLGRGTDRIAEEIKKLTPGYMPVIIDAEKTKTERQIATAMSTWRSQPGGILIGTETALLHMKDPIENVAIISLDSLLALPDFRVHERMMYILTRLRALATRSFMVQTRRPDEKVFEFALRSNTTDFFRMTKEERKQFMYPPFSILLKISIEGKKDDISKEMAVVRDLLTPHEISIFPAFTSAGRGKSTIHGLIKIKRDSWPDQDMVEKLRILPRHITIKVNPENLL